MTTRCTGMERNVLLSREEGDNEPAAFLLQILFNSSKLKGTEAHGDNRQKALRDAYRWRASRR